MRSNPNYVSFFLKSRSHQYNEISKTTKTRQPCDLDLATKAIEGPSLPLQCVHHVHCSNSLPVGMLGVSHSVPNHILEEHLQNAPSFLVNEPRDPLDPSPSCESPDGWLGNPSGPSCVSWHLPSLILYHPFHGQTSLFFWNLISNKESEIIKIA